MSAPAPTLCNWGPPLGNLYVFNTLQDVINWKAYVNYRATVTPEESNGEMLTHVWDQMIHWCEKNARGFWWHDGLWGIGFRDEGDAIRFKLTFV